MCVRRVYAEFDAQAAFFSVIRKLRNLDERWNLVYAVPNESVGMRYRAYRLGLQRGASDVNVDLPSGDGRYGYLRLEFKSANGIQSPEQKYFQRIVEDFGGGHYAIVRSADEAFRVLATYLGLPSSDFASACSRLLPRKGPIQALQPPKRTFHDIS
jgi:hypothetical protein